MYGNQTTTNQTPHGASFANLPCHRVPCQWPTAVLAVHAHPVNLYVRCTTCCAATRYGCVVTGTPGGTVNHAAYLPCLHGRWPCGVAAYGRRTVHGALLRHGLHCNQVTNHANQNRNCYVPRGVWLHGAAGGHCAGLYPARRSNRRMQVGTLLRWRAPVLACLPCTCACYNANLTHTTPHKRLYLTTPWPHPPGGCCVWGTATAQTFVPTLRPGGRG